MNQSTIRLENSENAKLLRDIGQKNEIEKLMVFGPNVKLPLLKKSISGILDSIGNFPSPSSPTYEQHAAFALELAVRALFANRERAGDIFPLFFAKFQSVAEEINMSSKIEGPFVVERIAVTILRCVIHLYSVAALRSKLKASLFFLPAFPTDSFIGKISDRMACGLAIILRSMYFLFKTPEEWKFFGESFDVLAEYKQGRLLVFDGMASTIEFAVPEFPTGENEDIPIEEYEDILEEKKTLSFAACASLQAVMFKFIYGGYNKDFTYALPAMVCIERTYKHMVKLLLIRQSSKDPDADLESVPDKDLWYRVGMAMYSVCTAADPKTSESGLHTARRHMITSIFMEEIPDEKWRIMLHTMIDKQPPVTDTSSRVNAFSLIGQLMIRLFPIMTRRKENWKDLTEITKGIVLVADENLRAGKEGGKATRAMFVFVVKIVTELANQLASPSFGGEKRYCAWASETFAKVLDKWGAAKGITNRKKAEPEAAPEADGGESASNEEATLVKGDRDVTQLSGAV